MGVSSGPGKFSWEVGNYVDPMYLNVAVLFINGCPLHYFIVENLFQYLIVKKFTEMSSLQSKKLHTDISSQKAYYTTT